MCLSSHNRLLSWLRIMAFSSHTLSAEIQKHSKDFSGSCRARFIGKTLA